MLNKLYPYAKFLLAGLLSGFSISFPFLLPLFFFGNYLFITGIISRKFSFHNFFPGWLFGFGFFLSSMHWIINPFLIYERHFILAPFILLIFPLCLGLFNSLASILITKFVEIYKINSSFLVTKCFMISLFLFLTEYLRSSIFGGLPFNLYAHVWIFDERFIKIVSFIGVFGLSFLTIFWITFTNILIYRRNSFFFLSLFFFPIFLVLISIMSNMDMQGDKSEKILVRVVQPNIKQEEKWNKIYFQDHLDKLIKLSTSKIDKQELIVIWPEVALTVYLNEQKDLLNYLSKNIKQNITIITGGLRRDLKDKEVKVFNSMYLIQKDKITFYDKKRLVPFGEFIPFRSFLRIFKLTHGETDFSVGKAKNQLSMEYYKKKLVIEPSICYEAIFQTFNSEKIDLFVNITNDAWFGSSTGPQQHLAASIFRSVEKGVPLIRSANSGISVITDSDGKILKKLDLNKSGYLESKLTIGDNSTFFTKYKKPILPILILILFFLNLIIDFFIKKRKSLKII